MQHTLACVSWRLNEGELVKIGPGKRLINVSYWRFLKYGWGYMEEQRALSSNIRILRFSLQHHNIQDRKFFNQKYSWYNRIATEWRTHCFTRTRAQTGSSMTYQENLQSVCPTSLPRPEPHPERTFPKWADSQCTMHQRGTGVLRTWLRFSSTWFPHKYNVDSSKVSLRPRDWVNVLWRMF